METRRQGESSEGRALIFDFMRRPAIAKRLDGTVRLLAGEVSGPVPYDVVLRARLDLQCCFGRVIRRDAWLEA